MYYNGFNKFYWGFLFIMLNIPIKGFDILPDIVGYILIYKGLSQLEEKQEEFKKGKKFALPMIFISILILYDIEFLFDKLNVGIGGWGFLFSFLIGILIIYLDFNLAYNIFMGIKNLAIEKEIPEIEKEAQNRWDNYKVLLIATIISLFLLAIPPLALIFLIGIFIFRLILLIRILQLMKQCKDRFV